MTIKGLKAIANIYMLLLINVVLERDQSCIK